MNEKNRKRRARRSQRLRRYVVELERRLDDARARIETLQDELMRMAQERMPLEAGLRILSRTLKKETVDAR